MKKPLYSCIVLLTLLLFIINCSTQTTECTGTETGNPVIIGCALSAKEIFENKDCWLPSTYLVNGETQLDASFSNTNESAPSLNKRSALLQSDMFSVTDSTYTITTIYDTVLRPRYAFVRDTIVNKYLRNDTVLDPVYGGTLISTYLHKDTTFVIDTIFLIDTSVIPRYDTIKNNDEGVYADVPIRIELFADSVTIKLDTSNKSKTSSYDLQIQQIIWRANSPVNPFINERDSVLFTINRRSTINGTLCNELYTSSDGDSCLYGASGSSVPGAKFVAVYENNNSSTKTQLDVNFDAGSDHKISTVANNRISFLRRTTMQNGVAHENVFYSVNGMANDQDAAYLNVSKIMTDTTASVQYRSLKGVDLLDHNQNKLVKVVKEVQFQNKDVKSINISVLLDKPLSKGETPEFFRFKANIDFGKGRVSEFIATIDLAKNTLDGIYAWNGVEYKVVYNFSTEEVILERLK